MWRVSKAGIPLENHYCSLRVVINTHTQKEKPTYLINVGGPVGAGINKMATSSPSQQHSLEQPLGILDSKGLEFIGNYRAIAAKLKKSVLLNVSV